ncbi:MAG: alanine racemase [Chloroflexi bacterium]|nr:alanine racemase [Chloroflexota bacterium]
METYKPNPGTPVADLDTPCLILELDSLEHNFKVIADTYKDTDVKLRAHMKNVKSPMLAKMQMDIGGTVNGVCCAKVAEAEVMVQGGIDDILIPNEIVTKDKIKRVCSLAHKAKIAVCVDNPQNLRDLSAQASASGVTLGVAIEVDTSMGRGGIRSPEEGVELAKLATSLPGIHFKGVMSHQSLKGEGDKETRYIEGRRYIQMCLDVRDAIEKAGIPVEYVSTGETFTYDVATEIPGITDVEGGTYALMSTFLSYMTEFEYAGLMLGTVISTPRPGVAIGDSGMRAVGAMCTYAEAWPVVHSPEGLTVSEMYDEQVVLTSKGAMPLKVGDKYFLRLGQQDVTVNRFDHYIGVRNGAVEAVWDIPARGCFH